jgi:hypothetical protein
MASSRLRESSLEESAATFCARAAWAAKHSARSQDAHAPRTSNGTERLTVGRSAAPDASPTVPPEHSPPLFQPSDVIYDADARTCICPAGKHLNRNGDRRVIRDDMWERFQGKKRDCGTCLLRAQCIRTPGTTALRAVMFFQGKRPPLPETHTARMKRRLESPEGRRLYGRRVGIAEPVFGNLRPNKGCDRFTLRGRVKVDGQWKLFLLHNMAKLAHSWSGSVATCESRSLLPGRAEATRNGDTPCLSCRCAPTHRARTHLQRGFSYSLVLECFGPSRPSLT